MAKSNQGNSGSILQQKQSQKVC